MDVSLDLADTHVLVTGGGGLIGTVVVDAFRAAGAKVSSLDIKYSKEPRFVPSEVLSEPGYVEHHVNTTSEESVKAAFDFAIEKQGPLSVCIALAALDLSVLQHVGSATELSVEQFRKTFDVNVTGTFITCREWQRRLEKLPKDTELKNKSLIIIGSEAGTYGSGANVDYGTSKSAVQYGMMKSFASSIPKQVYGARYVLPSPAGLSPQFLSFTYAQSERSGARSCGYEAFQRGV